MTGVLQWSPRGVSLSSLIERFIREATREDAKSFASRWRGQFRLAKRNDQRYDALAKKNLE